MYIIYNKGKGRIEFLNSGDWLKRTDVSGRLAAVAYRRGFGGSNPPSEIPEVLQNRAKLNPILKTVKILLNLGRQHPKMFGKKAVKF